MHADTILMIKLLKKSKNEYYLYTELKFRILHILNNNWCLNSDNIIVNVNVFVLLMYKIKTSRIELTMSQFIIFTFYIRIQEKTNFGNEK